LAFPCFTKRNNYFWYYVERRNMPNGWDDLMMMLNDPEGFDNGWIGNEQLQLSDIFREGESRYRPYNGFTDEEREVLPVMNYRERLHGQWTQPWTYMDGVNPEDFLYDRQGGRWIVAPTKPRRRTARRRYEDPCDTTRYQGTITDRDILHELHEQNFNYSGPADHNISYLMDLGEVIATNVYLRLVGRVRLFVWYNYDQNWFFGQAVVSNEADTLFNKVPLCEKQIRAALIHVLFFRPRDPFVREANDRYVARASESLREHAAEILEKAAQNVPRDLDY
jgi:hypothetical protein